MTRSWVDAYYLAELALSQIANIGVQAQAALDAAETALETVIAGGYAIVQQAGTALTARGILNFSSRFAATDDVGNTRTNVELATSGVSAGSYALPEITVDTYGRVTGATTVTGLTAGSIPYVSATGAIAQDNARLFWDATNHRLGVLTNSPDASYNATLAGSLKVAGKIGGVTQGTLTGEALHAGRQVLGEDGIYNGGALTGDVTLKLRGGQLLAEPMRTGYRETTGGAFPTLIAWYTDITKATPIWQREYTWTGVTPTTIVTRLYDAAGALSQTVTDVVTYSGVYETSRVRTVS